MLSGFQVRVGAALAVCAWVCASATIAHASDTKLGPLDPTVPHVDVLAGSGGPGEELSLLGTPAIESSAAARGKRMAAEAVGGAAGFAAGALVGSLGACAVTGCGGYFSRLEAVGVGGLPVGALGLSAGVLLAGGALDGDGGIGWTLLGELTGLGLAAVIASAGSSDATTAALLVLPLTGAVAGYELSSGAAYVQDVRPVAFERRDRTWQAAAPELAMGGSW